MSRRRDGNFFVIQAELSRYSNSWDKAINVGVLAIVEKGHWPIPFSQRQVGAVLSN